MKKTYIKIPMTIRIILATIALIISIIIIK